MTFETLDRFVIKTLENLENWKYPELPIKPSNKNVFLGSGSAACTGKLFADKFGGIALNASNYQTFFENSSGSDFASINIINASGGKDGIKMSEFLTAKGFEPNLMTCNPDPPAKAFIKQDNIFVFPALNDPPTYNVSTYGSMIYCLFKENPDEIKRFIAEISVPNLRTYPYIFFLASDKYAAIAEMSSRKVAETLEGIGSNGDGSTNGSHGMLRQPNKNRLVICLNQKYEGGENVYNLDIDSYLGLMMSAYYIIGKNQTDTDTKNLLADYENMSKKLGWKFNKVW